MTHGKAYCIFGEGTARRRAQCMEHRAAHMASYIYCGCSNSHMVSDRGGNHECKAPCTCESKLGDAHTGENMGNGSVPDNTSHSRHDRYGRILADDHMGSYIQVPLSLFCKSKHLAGHGRTLALK